MSTFGGPIGSAAIEQAHFDAKAGRYAGALRAYPNARNLELLPFLLLLDRCIDQNPSSLTACDLLCGSGFLTGALTNCFARIIGVDVSAEMLQYYPVSRRVAAVQASVEMPNASWRSGIRPDVIVSLAGIHHVYLSGGRAVDRYASDQWQRDVIASWMHSLSDQGVLVMGDVTAPDESVAWTDNAEVVGFRHQVLRNQFFRLDARLADDIGRGSLIGEQAGRSLRDYAATIQPFLQGGMTPSPARWFREVVNEHGLYGHMDHFPRARTLATALNDLGFQVAYYEFPTPWIFSSLSDMTMFFYDLFAFGPRVANFDEMPASLRELIVDLVKRYLGIVPLDESAVASGWRLGYYVVRWVSK